MMMPLDDFDMILGIDFFVNAQVTLMPYRIGIVICSGMSPCYVECILAWKDHSKKTQQMITSALQLKASLKKHMDTFVARWWLVRWRSLLM